MRFLKNSSLFFCMISSWVKPWLPFSTIFCTEDDALPWLAFTGSAAGAGEVESSGEDWDCGESRKKLLENNWTYPPFWYFYSSCHSAPCFCLHPLPQSSTLQFFGISRTLWKSAWGQGSELCCCAPPPWWFCILYKSICRTNIKTGLIKHFSAWTWKSPCNFLFILLAFASCSTVVIPPLSVCDSTWGACWSHPQIHNCS